MENTFKITIRIWPVWVAIYYASFWLGDPRRLNSGQTLFDVLAGLIILGCIALVVFPKHIGVSSSIGALALAHSLGASLTAYILADVLTAQLYSQIFRLSWVGVSVFVWVLVANKVIVTKDMTECLHPIT